MCYFSYFHFYSFYSFPWNNNKKNCKLCFETILIFFCVTAEKFLLLFGGQKMQNLFHVKQYPLNFKCCNKRKKAKNVKVKEKKSLFISINLLYIYLCYKHQSLIINITYIHLRFFHIGKYIYIFYYQNTYLLDSFFRGG